MTGTNELAATIQNQLRMTENIKQLTFTTRQSAKDVQDKFIGTRKAAEEGNQASFLISSATTAKPFPASPACAASILAFKASSVVWSVTSSIN